VARAEAEAYLHAKFHLDPSNRLATIHRYRQTYRQRSDSIGRTVLQMVAQKLTAVVTIITDVQSVSWESLVTPEERDITVNFGCFKTSISTKK